MDDAPIDYVIDNVKRLAVVTYRTQPNYEQWSLTFDQLLDDPNYDASFGVLFDRRQVLSPADTDYINRIARHLDDRRTAGKVGRCAVVVGDLGSYGMGRMLEHLTDFEGSIRTFRGLEEAERWLAVEM